MSLDNLVGKGLKLQAATRDDVARVVAAAETSLADAGQPGISAMGRFDSAYRCIMQCALAALMAHGFRPDKKQPGHHQLMIQLLPKTLGTDGPRVIVLDKLREKRNLADYEGVPVDDGSVSACVDHAARLLDDLRAWLAAHPKDLA